MKEWETEDIFEQSNPVTQRKTSNRSRHKYQELLKMKMSNITSSRHKIDAVKIIFRLMPSSHTQKRELNTRKDITREKQIM